MIKFFLFCLLAVIFVGCRATEQILTVKAGECYGVEYTVKPQYSPSVSRKIVVAINRLNNCDFVEAQTTLAAAAPQTDKDRYLVASYRAQAGAADMVRRSLHNGNYQQVVDSALLWSNFVKVDNDPLISKELYIAYKMLGNFDKAEHLAVIAFESHAAAELHFTQWHQKQFPERYKQKDNVDYAKLSRDLLLLETEQSISDSLNFRRRQGVDPVVTTRTDLSVPFSIYRVAPTAVHPGWVVLSYSVNKEGRTEDIEIIDVSPEGAFEADAINTLSKWLYLPAQSESGTLIKTVNLKVRLEVSVAD
ncbi:energy transducer TonB [Shewanella sp. 10N.286.54.B9]|uniref:energy transducer TonB n=1 Tax=Shewanella sp. 10N.286.54.B9 TaxID=3229719 RepID=UPI003552117A